MCNSMKLNALSEFPHPLLMGLNYMLPFFISLIDIQHILRYFLPEIIDI